MKLDLSIKTKLKIEMENTKIKYKDVTQQLRSLYIE